MSTERRIVRVTFFKMSIYARSGRLALLGAAPWDNVMAVMEVNHPHLTTQESFYVEISRARQRAFRKLGCGGKPPVRLQQ